MKKKFATFLVLLILVPCNLLAMDAEFRWDGWVRNNTGLWTQNFDFADNNDKLAAERSWLRLNLNGQFNEKLSILAEVLGVWEPEYRREENADIDPDEYNSYDFRELRLDYSPYPGHTLMLGRQIVNWGEALAGRVGDVVNPQDARFDLGFTNLEDSRMPILMLRGNHYLTSLNTSCEWIFSPYMEQEKYRVNRNGLVPTVFTDGTFTPGGRFGSYPEKRTDVLGGLSNMYLYYPGVGVLPASAFGLPVLGAPLHNAYQFMPANAFGPGSPAGYYFLHTPNVKTDYPDSSWEDARHGLRVSSTIIGTQMGCYYWHGNELNPLIRLDDGIPLVPGAPLNATLIYPEQDVYGIFMNKSTDIGLLRFDSAYRPNRNYNSFDYVKYPNGIAEKDNLMLQFGYDKSFWLRQLNSSQTIDLALEYIGEYILDDMDDIHVPGYFEKYEKNLHLIQARLTTNYGYGKYGYQIVALYYDTGCALLQPKFTYKPDWMNNKWQFDLQYNYIWAEEDYTYPLALMEEKDMILLTMQFSFGS